MQVGNKLDGKEESSVLADQQRTIHSLVRGLVEADHELSEAERRARRKLKRGDKSGYQKEDAFDGERQKLSEKLQHHKNLFSTNAAESDKAEPHLLPPAPPFVDRRLNFSASSGPKGKL